MLDTSSINPYEVHVVRFEKDKDDSQYFGEEMWNYLLIQLFNENGKNLVYYCI